MKRFGQSARRAALLALALLVVLASLAAESRAATLELRVVDEGGRPLPCRVAVRPTQGPGLVPEGAVELPIGPERWFISPGESMLAVPAGKLQLWIECGLEFVRFKETIDVAEPRATRTVTLKRWIDMGGRGYRSGESHLHVDPPLLAPMLAAEDLDFGTVTTWWNGPDKKVHVPPGTGRSRILSFGGRDIPASVHDCEVEHAWGALFIQNLPGPLPLPSDAGRPNLDFAKYATEAGGLVHYQGGWSREVAVDALLGYVQAVQLLSNNFQPHRFQPRSRYSNLLEVAGFPVYTDTDEGMLRHSLETYYRLLNWGLPLAASAGSSTDIKQTPAGYNRAYVRLGKEASLADFYRGWSAGRNFVTNGPMLFLKSEKGAQPGDTLELPQGGGALDFELSCLSDPQQELTSAEIVVNGEVAATFPISDKHALKGRTSLTIPAGSWIAARCTVRDTLLSDEELAPYANGDKQQPSRLRFAHTSPIYVTVGGQHAFVRKSAEEGLQILDRFAVFAQEKAAPEYRAEILKATAQARESLSTKLASRKVD